MTIKQVLIGAVLGTSVTGLMVHRMPKEKTTPMQPRTIASSKTDQHHRGESHKTASLPKHHRKDQNSKKLEAELSSRKLYGQ